MKDHWYSEKETAQYPGIKQDTLYKWIIRKDIPAHEVDCVRKFELKEVDA